MKFLRGAHLWCYLKSANFIQGKAQSKTYAVCVLGLVDAVGNKDMPQKHQHCSKNFHCSSCVDSNFYFNVFKVNVSII